MFKETKAFSSFSVDDMGKAKEFYGKELGIKVKEIPEGLELHITGSMPILIYQSDPKTYTPPKHTVLNFLVGDIDKTIGSLAKKGIKMEQYDLPMMKTDTKGVVRNDGRHPGPKAIAWFKDPADHVLAVIQEK